ncbi:MAG: hypothetical protein ACJAXX_002302, partial [Roseivirga sp.]
MIVLLNCVLQARGPWPPKCGHSIKVARPLNSTGSF